MVPLTATATHRMGAQRRVCLAWSQVDPVLTKLLVSTALSLCVAHRAARGSQGILGIDQLRLSLHHTANPGIGNQNATSST